VLILFNAMNVGYSLGVHFLYLSRPAIQDANIQLASMLPAVAILCMAIVHFYFMGKHNELFEHNNQMLKEDTLSKFQPIILFC